MSTETYMENLKSGEIHRLAEGRSREECNLDAARDAGALQVIDEADALRAVGEAPARACGHCWPKGEEGGDTDGADA